MKYGLITITFICLSLRGFSQSAELSEFKNAIFRLFPISEPKSDSCFSIYTMLIVDVNKNFSVSKLSFSDSAPAWMKEDLKKIGPKLKLGTLSSYSKAKKFTGQLVFPFIVRRDIKKCDYDDVSLLNSGNIFSQDGNSLSGIVKFNEPLMFLLGDYKSKK